jgi:hypothetical protein
MNKKDLIDEFITKHVFPQFREVIHPIHEYNHNGRYFAIGLNDDEHVAAMSHFDKDLLIGPPKWGTVQAMFSLTEDETIITLGRWFRKNVPLLSFDKIQLLRYP